MLLTNTDGASIQLKHIIWFKLFSKLAGTFLFDILLDHHSNDPMETTLVTIRVYLYL